MSRNLKIDGAEKPEEEKCRAQRIPTPEANHEDVKTQKLETADQGAELIAKLKTATQKIAERESRHAQGRARDSKARITELESESAKIAELEKSLTKKEFNSLRAKIMELESQNAKTAALERRPTKEELTILKAVITKLENKDAKIAEFENYPTKEKLRTLKVKLKALERENAKLPELSSHLTKGEIAILRAKITASKSPKNPHRKIGAQFIFGQCYNISARDEEQPTASIDSLPVTAAEDSDPAQLDAFSGSKEFCEMSVSEMQTQFNNEELSLQNTQKKLLKRRAKKEKEVKRHIGELAIMNKDVNDMEA